MQYNITKILDFLSQYKIFEMFILFKPSKSPEISLRAPRRSEALAIRATAAYDLKEPNREKTYKNNETHETTETLNEKLNISVKSTCLINCLYIELIAQFSNKLIHLT